MVHFPFSVKNKRGFTLLELIVVIGIIGILSTIGVTSFQASQRSSRDAKRKIDLETIKQALELYRSDNGSYPPISGCANPCNSYVYSTAGNSWISQLVTGGYLAKVPQDPINRISSFAWSDGDNYAYAYGNVNNTSTKGPTYDLFVRLENTNDSDRCGIKNYRFYIDDRAWCSAFGGSGSNQIYEVSN